MVFTFSVGRRMDNMKKLGEQTRAKKQQKIVEREDRLNEKAEADYIAEQKAKEVRQSKGLGYLITPAQNETEEEIAARKKKQGLGAAISSGGSTLG